MVDYDELSQIAFKHCVDKCPQIRNTYTPIYYAFLKDMRKTVHKVIEMGIGYPKMMAFTEEFTGIPYKVGASLRMWREFFPNAQIYGVDNRKDTMFEDIRIKTFCLDERKRKHIEKLIRLTGSNIDIFVDDGSHVLSDQIFLCRTAMPLLDRNVIYFIEDVRPKNLQVTMDALKDYYDVEAPTLSDPINVKPNKAYKLLIVRHKKYD